MLTQEQIDGLKVGDMVRHVPTGTIGEFFEFEVFAVKLTIKDDYSGNITFWANPENCELLEV